MPARVSVCESIKLTCVCQSKVPVGRCSPFECVWGVGQALHPASHHHVPWSKPDYSCLLIESHSFSSISVLKNNEKSVESSTTFNNFMSYLPFCHIINSKIISILMVSGLYLCPVASCAVASVIALSPLAHTLLTVVQGTVLGSPAPRAACRAGACPRPACSQEH